MSEEITKVPNPDALDPQTQALMRIVALMEANIWRNVEQFVRLQVPNIVMQTLMLMDTVRQNPWLSGREQDLLNALIEVKKSDPNVQFHVGLARAVDVLKQKETATDAEK